MAKREVTQFHMSEALAFDKNLPTHTTKQKAIADFVSYAATLGDSPFAEKGGPDNILRVRVLQDGDVVSYDYTLKLPLDIVARKRAQAERDRRVAEVLAKAAELRRNPKKFNEFVDKVVAGICGRATAALLLAGMPAPAAKKAKKPARVTPPKSKRDADRFYAQEASDYDKAIAQDRRQRIEAAKKGPKSLKSEGGSAAA